MLEQIEKGAEKSSCGTYRYSLWRIWDEKLPKVMFIGLNPSNADAVEDDHTITRCINFAKSWGFGGIYMTNLLAYIQTESDKLYKEHKECKKAGVDPLDVLMGEDNDKYILKYAKKADKIVAAWGNGGWLCGRSKAVCELLPLLYCLDINKSGEPKHPLYVASDTVLKPYERK